MSKPFLHRLHAKVYAGSWKNPLFADPKVRDRSSERVRYGLYSLLVLTSLVLLCTTFFWFGTQGRFAVNTVQVEGMRTLPNEKLALQALQTARACTHFFVPCLYTWNISSAHIPTALSATYRLDQISLKQEEHTVFLTVNEAVTMIPIRIASQVWFATQTGVLQGEATPEDISAGIVIPQGAYTEIDASAVVKNPTAGMQIRNAETFQQIATYKKAFFDHGVPIASFVITEDAGKIIAQSQAGFAIFFTPWEDAYTQTNRLTAVLAQAVPQSYVDIRFGERIYVK